MQYSDGTKIAVDAFGRPITDPARWAEMERFEEQTGRTGAPHEDARECPETHSPAMLVRVVIREAVREESGSAAQGRLGNVDKTANEEFGNG